MSVELLNFIETVLNGLMSGVMYSLVALGFVLIFKAFLLALHFLLLSAILGHLVVVSN